MANDSTQPLTEHEPNPELVELMRARVVRHQSRAPKNPKPGPGRPKGCTKPPGSGKKAGYPNLMSPEFRQWLAKRAKPFELLAAICRGDEIDDGGEMRHPTLTERMKAAETLMRKIVPDLQATKAEVSGPNGGPLEVERLSKLEMARQVASLLEEGAMAMPAHRLDLSDAKASLEP